MTFTEAAHALFKAGFSPGLCRQADPGILAPARSTPRASSHRPRACRSDSPDVPGVHWAADPPSAGTREAKEVSILAFPSFLLLSSFRSILQVPLPSTRTRCPRGTRRHMCPGVGNVCFSPDHVLRPALDCSAASCGPCQHWAWAWAAHLSTRPLARAPLVLLWGMWPRPRVGPLTRLREGGFFLLMPQDAMQVCMRPQGDQERANRQSLCPALSRDEPVTCPLDGGKWQALVMYRGCDKGIEQGRELRSHQVWQA